MMTERTCGTCAYVYYVSTGVRFLRWFLNQEGTTVSRIGPGWYQAWPMKDHAGGHCNYCLSIIYYEAECLDADYYLPEVAQHVMRRLDADTAVVYELEGRQADYIRDEGHTARRRNG